MSDHDDGMLGGLAGVAAMISSMILPVIIAGLCPVWWLKAAIMISWVGYIFGSIFTSSIQQMLEGQANLPMRLGVKVTDRVDSWVRRKRERRIQRKTLDAEWIGVPDGAISRAQPGRADADRGFALSGRVARGSSPLRCSGGRYNPRPPRRWS